MEKRQRIAMLVVLTRYNRFLEGRGVIKSAGHADKLLTDYVRTLNDTTEAADNSTPPDRGNGYSEV